MRQLTYSETFLFKLSEHVRASSNNVYLCSFRLNKEIAVYYLRTQFTPRSSSHFRLLLCFQSSFKSRCFNLEVMRMEIIKFLTLDGNQTLASPVPQTLVFLLQRSRSQKRLKEHACLPCLVLELHTFAHCCCVYIPGTTSLHIPRSYYYLLSPNILFLHILFVLHFLFQCTFYSLFIIYMLLCCYFYIIFICIILHCPLSGPDLIYISLLIIPCIIYYVTNKETLNLWLYLNMAINK